MSRTLKVTGNHVMCMISKGNLVNFARLVLPAVSEEEETWLTSFCVQCIIKRLLHSVFVISRIIKDLNRVISRSRRLGLITITSTLIILDITKTSSLFIIRSHNRVRRPQPRAISTFGAVPMIWNKLRHRLPHKRLLFAKICADVAQGKWRPKFPKSLMLLANNSTLLWLLEFCSSIFVVGCSSLKEVRCPPFFCWPVELHCSFYKNFIYSTTNFTPEED